MKGSRYLSEVGLTLDRFKNIKINIIECPTGGGKTHFAFNELPKFTQSNYCILYLTDTNMNREQILSQNENTTFYDQSFRELMNQTPKEEIIQLGSRGWGDWKEVKIRVMNYAQVGAILYYEHPFDWSKFDYVVCDELQNLVKWQNIVAKDENGKPKSVNILSLTRKKIEHTLYHTEAKIIALTATPDKVKQAFKNVFYVLDPQEYNSIYQYETNQIFHYRDYVKAFDEIPIGKRGIIFFIRFHN